MCKSDGPPCACLGEAIGRERDLLTHGGQSAVIPVVFEGWKETLVFISTCAYNSEPLDLDDWTQVFKHSQTRLVFWGEV